MDVDDDVELVGQRLIDGPVNALGEFRLDRVGRLRLCMSGPADRQPDRGETSLLDGLEIFGFELYAPVAFLRGFEGVAEVDAAADVFVDGDDVLGECLSGKNREGQQYA